METTLNRIVIKAGNNQFVFGGGGSGQPAPNSVGTEEIKDGSVQMEDLSPEVRKGLDELDNISLTDEDIEKWFDDDPNNDDPEETHDTQEAGAGSGEVEGGGADLDSPDE